MSENIYVKINEIRGELHRLISENKIKKTGKNQYHKASFYSLDDLVGPIQRLLNEKNLYHEVNICDRAIMNIINLDNVEEIMEISIPLPEKFSTMRDVGSAITYSRRYLYYILFNIADVDDDYASKEKEEVSKKQEKPKKNSTNPQKILKDFKKIIVENNGEVNKKNLTVMLQGAHSEGKITLNELRESNKFLNMNGVDAI